MENIYTYPAIETIDIHNEGILCNSTDSPADGYGINRLEGLD